MPLAPGPRSRSAVRRCALRSARAQACWLGLVGPCSSRSAGLPAYSSLSSWESRWRSERLTAVVIPVQGDPIVVTPFFEKPSVEESLKIPAEVRVWQEDEEPLKLVAGFLKERGVAGAPVGFEETNRYFILDRLRRHLPNAPIVSANPVVRASRMIKSPAELALMQAAADITVAAYREIHPKIREGMTPSDINELYVAAIQSRGASTDGGLILLGYRPRLDDPCLEMQRRKQGLICSALPSWKPLPHVP